MTLEQINKLTEIIIGASIEVHRTLGPGLFESAYKTCLCRELELRGIPFRTEVALPLTYKGINLDCGYRLDLLVAETVPVEIKAIEALNRIHEVQLVTYLRLGGWKVGLLINFHEPILINGIRRKVSGLDEGNDRSASSAALR